MFHIGGRAAGVRGNHRESGRHGLEQGDAELFLHARADIHPIRRGQGRSAVPGRGQPVQGRVVGAVPGQKEPLADRSGKIDGRGHLIQLAFLVDRRGTQVSAEDEQIAAGAQVGIRGPRLHQRRHALHAVQPPDADGERKPASARRERGEQVVQFRQRYRAPLTELARGVGAHRRAGVRQGALDHGEVDALRNHGMAFRMMPDVDTHEVAHIAPQLGPREEHDVRGIRRQALHQPGPEPEVLGLVDGAEVRPGQRPRGVEGVDHAVRVRGHREHDRDVEFPGHGGRSQRADVGHPQVDRVDGAGCAQHATDAALRRDPSRPRVDRGDGFAQERHRREGVPRDDGPNLGQARDRAGETTAGKGQHPLDRAATAVAGNERVTQAHEQRGDAPVVAGPHLTEFTVDVGVQEQLGHREPLAPRWAREGRHGQVEEGQPRHVREHTARQREVAHDANVSLVRTEVTEGSDGGRAHVVGLGTVDGDPAQQSFGDAPGYQTHRLDQAGAGIARFHADQGTLEGERHVFRHRGAPLFERALGEHAGEPAVDHHAQ